jgi:hypothetical protein
MDQVCRLTGRQVKCMNYFSGTAAILNTDQARRFFLSDNLPETDF